MAKDKGHKLIAPDGTEHPFDEEDFEVLGITDVTYRIEHHWFNVRDLIVMGGSQMRSKGIFPIRETLDLKSKMVQCEVRVYDTDEEDADDR